MIGCFQTTGNMNVKKYCDGLPIRRLSLLSNSRIYRRCCRCNRFPGNLCRCHSTERWLRISYP
jgi:hypothetical protein